MHATTHVSFFFNVVAEVLLWSVPWLELRFFMPHFSKETTATLKAALRARAGEGYRFSDHDIEKLATSTSLSAAQVKQWNHNILHYYQTDQAKEAYVAGNDKVSTKRCDITTLENLSSRTGASIARFIINLKLTIINFSGGQCEGKKLLYFCLGH